MSDYQRLENSMVDLPKHTETRESGRSVERKPKRRSHLERTELSDRLMLDAARELILELGTQKTTLKEIGERAGYSRGLAQSRFGSKDNLFVKLADRSRRRWLIELQKAAADQQGIAVLISRLDAILSFAELHPGESRAMYILWFESVGVASEINASLARFHQQARDDIKSLALAAGLFQAEKRAGRYATQLCGTLFGLCYQYLVDPDAVDLRLQIEDMKSEILA